MFDFSNLFCCNPNCPCRRNANENRGVENRSGNENRDDINARNGGYANDRCGCGGKGNVRPIPPRVIIGPRGPRGYTGATGATGADGSVANSTAILTSAAETATRAVVNTSTEVLQNGYLPVNTELKDGGNFVTVNGDNTFSITEEGVYFAVFTVQFDTALTPTASAVTVTLSDVDGVIYGYLSRVDSDKNIPFVGYGVINVESVSNKYALVNASTSSINLAPLLNGSGGEIRPATQISITKLN